MSNGFLSSIAKISLQWKRHLCSAVNSVPMRQPFVIYYAFHIRKNTEQYVFSKKLRFYCWCFRLTLLNTSICNASDYLKKFNFLWKSFTKRYFSYLTRSEVQVVRCCSMFRSENSSGSHFNAFRMFSMLYIRLTIVKYLTPRLLA